MNERHISLPFVLLFHEVPPARVKAMGRSSHWDFMVATNDDGPLRTWALDAAPDFDRGDDFAITAQSLPDHRREYLEYEGPVSGDRGSVSRVASGTATWERKTPGAEKILLRLENDQKTRAVWTVTFARSGNTSTASFERVAD